MVAAISRNTKRLLTKGTRKLEEDDIVSVFAAALFLVSPDSPLDDLNELLNKTRPVAVNMTLLIPRAEVAGTVKFVDKAMLADMVAAPRTKNDLEGLFCSGFVAVRGDSCLGSAVCLKSSSFSESTATSKGSRP